MGDYIEREAALTAVLLGANRHQMAEYIANLPAADVRPVVRCGECKHWKRVRNNCFLASCELDDVVRSEDFFCADGKKREGS